MSEPRTTWRDIAGELRAAIIGGEYGPGDRLPSRSALMERFGVAPQTVVNAINALRAEGLVVGLTGSGWYVREETPVVGMSRTRLSRTERAAGRGAFTSDAHAGGWAPQVQVDIHTVAASEEIAAHLDVEAGAEVLVRERVMSADGRPVMLATSYLPRTLTAGTAAEQENTGPGGIYARLEEAGHALTHFTEGVRIGQASVAEAEHLDVPVGAPVFRIRRVAHSAQRPVEVNLIVAPGERYELYYELAAE